MELNRIFKQPISRPIEGVVIGQDAATCGGWVQPAAWNRTQMALSTPQRS